MKIHYRFMTFAEVVCSLVVILFLNVTSPAAESRSWLGDLPRNGAWVSYYVEVEARSDQATRLIKLSSVGSTTHEGAPARWIELAVLSTDETETFDIVKMLIPEAAFAKQGNPIEKAVKIWGKKQGEDVAEYASLREYNNLMAGILRGGRMDAEETDETRTISWQRGSLEARKVAVESDQTFGRTRFQMKQNYFVNEKVPFHLAAARLEVEVSFGQRRQVIEVDATLQDMGQDAKSLIDRE